MAICPEQDRFQHLLDHRGAEPAEWSEFESHAQTCRQCANRLSELADVALFEEQLVGANVRSPARTSEGELQFVQHLLETPPEPMTGDVSTQGPPSVEDCELLPGAPRIPRDASSAFGPRYRVLRSLAAGGLGKVHVAYDTELDREVAIKEIKTEYADLPDVRARFEREAEVTGRLDHPGIVPVHSLQRGDSSRRPYYAMRRGRGDAGLHEPRASRGGHAASDIRQRRLLLGNHALSSSYGATAAKGR